MSETWQDSYGGSISKVIEEGSFRVDLGIWVGRDVQVADAAYLNRLEADLAATAARESSHSARLALLAGAVADARQGERDAKTRESELRKALERIRDRNSMTWPAYAKKYGRDPLTAPYESSGTIAKAALTVT
jgi:predicted methyltransferase MtxX (methanogen marker protein 4)